MQDAGTYHTKAHDHIYITRRDSEKIYSFGSLEPSYIVSLLTFDAALRRFLVRRTSERVASAVVCLFASSVAGMIGAAEPPGHRAETS